MLYVKRVIYIVTKLSLSALRIHWLYGCMLYWLQHMFKCIQINNIEVKSKRVSELCCDITSFGLFGERLHRFTKNGMKRAAMDSIDNCIGTNPKQANLVERNPAPNGYELLNPNYVGKRNAYDLVALATEIQNADVAVNHHSGKLSLIIDQIRFLQSQAHQILRDMKTDVNLHQAACNFKKIPGKTYYLYQRDSGQCYFSMLSPEEWGTGLSHKFLGGYRLESDKTWTPLDRIGDVDEKKQITKKLIQSTDIAESFRAIAYSQDNMDMDT